MIPIETPYEIYTGLDGKPLTNGMIYIGEVGEDPTVPANQVPIFWDEALTIPAAQPVRTNAGYIVRNGTPSNIFANDAYSMTVQDDAGGVVFYLADSSETVSGYLQKLLSSAGSSFIGFIAGGFGAVRLSLQSLLRNWCIPEMYGAKGDGVTDDTIAIQRALNSFREVRLVPGKTYIVSPQNLSNPETGNGICLNIPSNTHFVMHGALLKQANGTGGGGGIISNTSPVSNVLIEGGAIDGNSANTFGNMPTILLFNSTDCEVRNVRCVLNRFIGIGFRATASGYGRNSIRDCTVQQCLYIGIQCARQEMGLEISRNVVENTTDNAIDVEGNNLSGGPGYGAQTIIADNRCRSFSNGIFMESVGNAIIHGNWLQNFNLYGIVLNRINSGAYDCTITSNKLKDGAGQTGILINNASGDTIIDSNSFDTMKHSFRFTGGIAGLSIGKNFHKNLTGESIFNIPQGVNNVVRCHAQSQDYRNARGNGMPFTVSPLTNPDNSPQRSFTVRFEPTYYMEEGLQSATLEDEYKDSRVGSLSPNPAWGGAYSVYTGGETNVYVPSGSLIVGHYVKINNVLYQVFSSPSGGVFILRSSAGAAGNYTGALNSNYQFVEYWPQWQTT